MESSTMDPDGTGPRRSKRLKRSVQMEPPEDKFPVLDVLNFAFHWPVWSEEFQLHVAAKYDNYLADEKLQLKFLWECLGAEGSSLAEAIYPVFCPKLEPFREVWWRLNELWRFGEGRCRVRVYTDQRRHLKQSDVEDIKKDQEKWQKLIPHMTLCDLVFLEEAAPQLKRIIWNHSEIFGVCIEKCCLENLCLNSNKVVCLKYKAIPSVTLKNLRESDVRVVTAFFENISLFSMHNMVVIEDVSVFPRELLELKLVDCKIEKKLMDEWMSFSKSTCERLCLDNFKHTFPLVLPEEKKTFFEYKRWLHFEKRGFNDNYVDIDEDYLHIHFIKLYSLSTWGDFTDYDFLRYQSEFVANSKQIIVYVPGITPIRRLGGQNVLFLAIKENYSWFNERDIPHYPRLTYLWYVSPEPRWKAHHDRLKVDTVVLHYDHIFAPPKEPNLIFEMLNEYCLLEIADYLSVSDWIKFGELHWKVEMALVSYKYPRAEVNDRDLPYWESEYINYAAQFVTKLHLSDCRREKWLNKFSSLKSWTAGELCSSEVSIDSFPNGNGLEKFVVTDWKGEIEFRPYFRKLNPTLKVLGLGKFPGVGCFSEFHNLREIEICISFPVEEVVILLKQNVQLQRVQISLRGFRVLSEKLIQPICALTELKEIAFPTYNKAVCGVLNRSECKEIEDKNKIVVANLLEGVAPKLTAIRLSGNLLGPQMLALAQRGLLSNIQEFILEDPFTKDDKRYFIAIISRMKSLKKLCIRFHEYYTRIRHGYYFKIVEDVRVLIKYLPCLEELEMPGKEFAVRYEIELREELHRNNRQLRINKTQYP